MTEKIAYVVVVSLLLFVGGGLLLPREIHVERSVDIQRPANTLFTLLNRPDSFPAWSPWVSLDPELSYHFAGPASGVGARLEWSGNPRLVGKGWLEIVESSPASLVGMKLVVLRQLKADTAFTVERIAGGSRVSWALDTDVTEGQGLFGALVSRYFGLVYDNWLGGDFDQGLQRLKAYAESLPAADFSGLEVAFVDAAPMDVLVVSRPGGTGSHAASMASAYREITAFMAENGIEMSAQPLALTRIAEDGSRRFEAVIPVQAADVPGSANVAWGRSPSGPAVRTVYRGAYDGLDRTYGKLAAWMAAHGYRAGPVSWEQYISDPAETAEAERVTHIYISLAE